VSAAGACWIIVDRQGQSPLIVAQLARLRGLRVRLVQTLDGVFAGPCSSPRTLLLAAGVSGLESLNDERRQRLCSLIHNGATLYVRGGFRPGSTLRKLPFAEHHFKIGTESLATALRFSDHALLPSALEGEEIVREVQALGANWADGPFEELLSGSFADGKRRAIIFAKRAGQGVVIYDLQPSDGVEKDSRPMLTRLEDPATRSSCVGALAAVDRACGRDAKHPIAFNLTIDDRPTNYDYFNLLPLRALLEHLEHRYPGTHIDFAWVPTQTRPSQRYVATLKQFNAGFLWHGLCRHIDHRSIKNSAAELAAGKRLVDEICRRYRVRFQPVMVFPYERSSVACVNLIETEGFIACAESHESLAELDRMLPEYLRGSGPGRFGSTSEFVTLFRYPMSRFTRDTFLARAALGLPIMVAAHPGDVGLRRLSSWRKESALVSHFDPLLDFAAAKKLRPCSVEQIAHEVIEEAVPARQLASASA
jgi:hypothetical protein